MRVRDPLAVLSCLVVDALATPACVHRSPAAGLPDRWRHAVTVDPALRHLGVTVCFDGAAPERLVPPTPAARPALEAMGPWTSPPPPGDPGAGRCAGYRIDVAAAAALGWNGGLRAGGAVVLSSETWLWRPPRWAAGARVTARFDLPPGLAASVPWAPVPGTSEWVLDASAYQWEGYMVLGRFAREAVAVPGAVLDVARLGPMDAPVGPWLGAAGAAAAGLFGRFPAERAQVLVVPRARARSVAFGLTSRGGGASVLLLVDRSATAADLASDWVAVHEFVHFTHPVMHDDAVWLGEGLATYYQAVLRARAGLRTPAEAWEELLDGFDRGAAAPHARPLADESAAMAASHNYQRVYWTGAAMALLADVELRRRSGGRRSLDAAVRALHDCCATSTRAWSAGEVAAVFDAAAGTAVWAPLVDRYGASADFPDAAGVCAQLGVRRVDGRVVLDAHSPLAWVREAITAHR